MPQSEHSHAAEMHMRAAHAHTAAAAAQGKGDHVTAEEMSKRAHEHSSKAFKASEEILGHVLKPVKGDFGR